MCLGHLMKEFRASVGADLVLIVLGENLMPLEVKIHPRMLEFHDLKFLEDTVRHAMTDVVLQWAEWSHERMREVMEENAAKLRKLLEESDSGSSSSGGSALN